MRVALAALLLTAATALGADDFPWFAVHIETIDTDVVEGRPVTLRLALPCLNCTSPVNPIDLPVSPSDVVSWSFGDGTPDVNVTGSARVTHTFPRGWFTVTARLGEHVFTKRIFSAPVFVLPESLVSFTIPSLASPVSEAAGAYVIHMVRSGNLDVSSTIGFSTDGDTTGLTTTSGTVTFAPGETSKDISLGLVNDALFEATRYITITIWSVDGAVLQNVHSLPSYPPYVAMFQFNFAIADDDPRPTLSVSDIVVPEGNDGQTTPAAFNVKLSTAGGGDLSFYYFIVSGTAMLGKDYTTAAPSGTLVIPAGATTASIPVSIIGNGVAEPDKKFQFQIRYPDLSTGVTATGTILNDDTTLTPDPLRVARGTHPSILFDIGNPVATTTPVTLVSSAPDVVRVPSNVTFPAGSSQLIIPIDPLVPGEAIVQAGMGAVSAQAHVDVVEVTSLRVAPASITLAAGETETVHLSFAPPVAEPHTVTLTARGPGAISFPASVVVPAGGTADLALRATSEGWVAIDASAADLLTATSLLAEVVGAGGPAIDAVTPLFGPAGTRVTISGSRFSDRCSVAFGDRPAVVESRGGSLLMVVAPPNAGGAVDVAVTCGASQATKARAFTYTSVRRRPSR